MKYFQILAYVLFTNIIFSQEIRPIDEELKARNLLHLKNKYSEIFPFYKGLAKVSIKKNKSYSDTIDGKYYKDFILNYEDLYEPLITEGENISFSFYDKLTSENKLIIDFNNYFQIGDSIYRKVVDTVHRLLFCIYKGRQLTLLEVSKNKFNINYINDSIPYLYGFIDTFGNEIVPTNFVYINQAMNQNIIYFNSKDGYCGIMNLMGKVYFKDNYLGLGRESLYYAYGKIYFAKHYEKISYNKYGEQIKQTLYSSIIDTNGNILFPKDTYVKLKIINENLDFVNGFIYKNKKKLSNDSFDFINIVNSGLLKISKNKKLGYLNKHGKLLIPPIYDYLEDFLFKYLSVKKDSKTTIYYNKNGEIIDLVSKYKNLEINKLPTFEIFENDLKYMEIYNDITFGETYRIKETSPNANYKIYRPNKANIKNPSTLLYECTYIETLLHGKKKNYYNSKIDREETYYFGDLKF